MITIGGVTVDNPFTESAPDESRSTVSGSEGTANERSTPADEENATTPPSEPTESDPETSDDRNEDDPGVNFVPAVKDFSVSIESFDESSPDVEDGYVTPGEHRLLRFDMTIYNVGDRDAELGRPENRSDLFEHSDSHDHHHLRDFNKYVLFDEHGNEMGVGKKQTFCLMDSYRMPSRSNASSDPQFDCDYQGISAGWADVYDSSLPGQYLVIDTLPDGNYTLQATTNAEGTIDENCDDDNTVRVDLHIDDNTVTAIDPSRSRSVRASAC